jgi:hypothetical protein
MTTGFVRVSTIHQFPISTIEIGILLKKNRNKIAWPQSTSDLVILIADQTIGATYLGRSYQQSYCPRDISRSRKAQGNICWNKIFEKKINSIPADQMGIDFDYEPANYFKK